MSVYDLAIGFAGNPLDRLFNLRDDAGRLAELGAAPRARAVVFVQSMPVLRAAGDGLLALHPLAAAQTFGPIQEQVLLGRDAEGPIFALLLPDEVATSEAPQDAMAFVDRRELILPGLPELQIRDLRPLANRQAFSREVTAILAQAKTILHFHASHRYCARCGALTRAAHAGWRRDCPVCGALHFPRTDPVAIMMVEQGDFCLLGRQKRFPEKMYSCLAGFVEGGETLEEAVRREVMEEAGIAVGAVRYVASQPWPFPASLMMGCRAQAISRDITMDPGELEDCRWFSRAEVLAMIEGRHEDGLFAPNPFAIAHALLEHWLKEA